MNASALPAFHFDAASLRARNARLPTDQRIDSTVRALADHCWVTTLRIERALQSAGLLTRHALPSMTALAGGLAAVLRTRGPGGEPHPVQCAVFSRAALALTDVVVPTPALRMSVCEDVFEASARLIDVLFDMREQLRILPDAAGRVGAARANAAGLDVRYVQLLNRMLRAGSMVQREQYADYPLPTSPAQAAITPAQARAGLDELRRMTRPLIRAAGALRMTDHVEAAGLLLETLESRWPALAVRRLVLRTS